MADVMMTSRNTTESGNAVDAAIDAGALFEVHSTPMEIEGGFVPTIHGGMYEGQPMRKVTYREMDNGSKKVLNIAHPSFPESNYLQVFETAEALFPDSTTNMVVLEDGGRLLFSQEIGEAIDLGNGDEIKPSLLWTASLDSTWATGCHGLAERAFCSNQLPLAKVHMMARRTINHDSTLAYRAQILAGVMDQIEVFVQNVSTLRGITLSKSQFDTIISKILPAPADDAHGKTVNAYAKKMAAVNYYYGEEAGGPAAGTAWAAFNAIQSAESHSFTEGKNQIRKQADIIIKEDQPLTVEMERACLALA